ncbi:MAG: SAM-dependent methyltransferase [Bacteroidota bacterium]|nr:SAM-dependent methyltransferase [Bacteroidota bacterium]
MNKKGTVYLIPSLLDEKGTEAIPSYLLNAVKDCQVFFTENERTARRYLKQLWKARLPGEQEIIIDNYEWFTIHKAEEEVIGIFREKLLQGKNAGIISEAGCPGIADPGQLLVAAAHEMNVEIKPLVGPNSVTLALMASGMNGQRFQFAGYLPIDNHERVRTIKELEAESQKKNCTQLFIETPYRNNQLFETLVKTCKPSTRLCMAADLTGPSEWIKTRTIAEWKKENVNIHKRPVIFLLLAQ